MLCVNWPRTPPGAGSCQVGTSGSKASQCYPSRTECANPPCVLSSNHWGPSLVVVTLPRTGRKQQFPATPGPHAVLRHSVATASFQVTPQAVASLHLSCCSLCDRGTSHVRPLVMVTTISRLHTATDKLVVKAEVEHWPRIHKRCMDDGLFASLQAMNTNHAWDIQ